MFARSQRSIAAFAVAAIVLAACGDDEPESITPAITVPDGDTAQLIEIADLMLVAGFEDAEEREFSDVGAFENPDQRGPCGGRVPDMSTDPTAGRVIVGPAAGLVQLLVPTTDVVVTWIDALQADTGPPCDGYVSVTNEATTQDVSEITVYDVSGDDADGIAWTSRVDVEDSSVYVGLIVISTGDTTTIVQVQSVVPIQAEGVQFIAEAATLRLMGG